MRVGVARSKMGRERAMCGREGTRLEQRGPSAVLGLVLVWLGTLWADLGLIWIKKKRPNGPH